MNGETRSPLKDKPLRNPGQSLDEHRFDLAYDKLLTPYAITVFLCLLAALEWWQYFLPSSPPPLTFTAFALAGIGCSAYQFWRIRPRLRAPELAAG